ncbi:SurA N-terminal domain-containing protein [Sulfurospirillum sp. 1307]
MKTSSRILVSLALCSTLGFSGIVSGVSIIINKEPITLYEVYKYSKKYNLSKKEALDVLVRQKLENAQIKKLRISASDFEVDNYIEKIATQNNMSPFEFLNMLKEKGIDEDQYRKDLKQKIKVEKLYAQIYREKLTNIKEDDVKSFYEKNLDQFKIANKFDVVIYSSKNEEDLKALKKNPMLKPEGIQIKAETLTSNKLNDQLKALLSATKDGTFTNIINLGGNPTMIYVKSKADIKTIPFENAKNNIYRLLSNKQEQEALKDYFEKLKASANIQVIRNPS